MAYRYYLTLRPPAPGAIPSAPVGGNIIEVVSFDEKTFVESIGREAWGYVEYDKPIDAKVLDQYDMIPDQKKLVVYKYPLSMMVNVNTFCLPIVKPLKIDIQNGEFYLWALVDLNAKNRKFEVVCLGTGQPIYGSLEGKEHIATTITHDDKLVLHWFIDKFDK